MFVVTLPPSAIKKPLEFVKKAKNAGTDILEIRSDLTPGVKPFRSPLPLLLAIRGGEHEMIERLKPEFVDFDAKDIVETQNFASLPKNVRLHFICSYHNHTSTPSFSDLKKIVQKMCSSSPWMIKIAVQVNAYNDFLTLRNLQAFLNKKSVRSTVLAMGPKAHLLRALSPITNHWTYVCLDGFDASAVGQIPMSFYRFMSCRSNSALYGILGGLQVSASLSPTIQNALFQKYKIPAIYSCFPTDDLDEAWTSLTRLGVRGFSVTAPYKKDILSYLDAVDPLVAYLASANTVVKTKHGWMGYNTDVDGFVRGYPQLKKVREVAILGAGGVVPAIIEALSILAPEAYVTVYARDVKKSGLALAPFSVDVRSLRSLKNARHDAIICAIADDVSIPLPRTQTSDLRSHTSVAIDLRYGKRTRFMIDAEKNGFAVYDGLPMLIHQALRQFEIFSGKKTVLADVRSLQKLLKAHHS